jgi:hypothetical protein
MFYCYHGIYVINLINVIIIFDKILNTENLLSVKLKMCTIKRATKLDTKFELKESERPKPGLCYNK